MASCAAMQCATRQPATARAAPSRPAAKTASVLPRPVSGCACGGSCPRCSTRPRLTALDDAADERDADAFARRAAPLLAGMLDDSLSGRRAPLPPAAIDRLQRAAGLDAAAVTLRADEAAGRELGARAYTLGNDIAFDRGQYRPDSDSGRHLLAHELAHVVQQRRGGLRVQRSPYGTAHGSDEIHDRLTEKYERDLSSGVQPAATGGLQYTPGYMQWLGAQVAPAVAGPRFLPTTFAQRDPLQQRPVAANGLTTFFVNGKPTAGLALGQVLATIQGELTPKNVLHAPGIVAGQTQCRFDPAQRIDSQTHVDELTAPPAGGWKASLAPADVGAAAQCAGKATVPVTLTDVSGDPAKLAKLVHDSELEHVAELHALHDRHFVPYYRFLVGLSATAGNAGDCEARLRAQVADRDAQAATAFVLGDLAATRRYDDPASTHHGALKPTVSPGCSGVTLTARQVNPPLPGAGPGNVMPVAPSVTAIDPMQLSVSGSTLKSAGSAVRAFASAADATTAMSVFATLGVTEIRRIGPVEILFAGAQAASGALVSGLPKLDIHPDQYQVTVGMPTVTDWVISEMMGSKFFELANFGASRDEAYSAAALMTGNAISRQYRIGAAGGPGLTFYTA